MSKLHPICPRCGAPAERQTTRYGVRFAHCDMWAWGHHELVDAETHAARSKAHNAFDPLWKQGTMSRSEAYKWLAETPSMTREQCHMKLMNKDQAMAVVAAVHKRTRKAA